MTTVESTPLLSLQSPKDTSIDTIERDLSQIWQSSSSVEGMSATRASTFTLVVYEPEETQQLLSALGYYTGPVDGIAGPRTTAAIKAAQKAFELTVTGETSPELVDRLKTALRFAQTATTAEGAPKAAYVPDLEGSGVADAIAATNPCRIIALVPSASADDGVHAQVSAYCPVQKQSQNALVCCEYITLSGGSEALDRVGGMVSGLLLSQLPTIAWWKATPDPDHTLLQRLAAESDLVVFDSSTFKDAEADLLQTGKLSEGGLAISDLNWMRLAAWQELAAAAFDPPERRTHVWEVDRVTIDYEKGNQAQALLYLGWLASRLQWTPTAYTIEGGDYDLRRVKFVATGSGDYDASERIIEAELAGLPVANAGSIQGDLVGLRLSSTNLQADCCTVLCSESTGCMRMEAGGGAQACHIEQVTPIAERKTEQLLTQQLQRLGRDALYEESLTAVANILKLRS